MEGKTGEPVVQPCNCLPNFLLKQKMQLVIVNSRSLIFSVAILGDIGEIGAGRNFGIDNLQCNRYWYAGEDSTEIK